MKKFIKRVLVFFVIYIGIIQLLNLLVPYHWGNSHYSSKIQYLEKHNITNKFNVFYFGSSRVYRQVDPEIVDSVFNANNSLKKIKSFNLGSPSTFNPESLYLYNNFLDSKLFENTEIAFLELTDVSKAGELHEERSYYYQNFLDSTYLIENFLNDDGKSKKQRLVELSRYFILNLDKLIFPANYKHFLIEDNFYDNIFLGEGLNGFYSLEEQLQNTKSSRLKNNLMKRRENLSIKELEKRQEVALNSYLSIKKGHGVAKLPTLNKMKNLIEKSKKHGVHLIFIISARNVSEDLLLIASQLPESHILDLGDPRENEFAYSLKYSFDKGHLNDAGAKKYSILLAQKLSELHLVSISSSRHSQ